MLKPTGRLDGFRIFDAEGECVYDESMPVYEMDVRDIRKGNVASSLIQQYKAIARKGGNFRGLSLLAHAEAIAAVCQRHRARSLLDYGSGAGDAYRDPYHVHHGWGLKKTHIILYDPAFPHIDHLPVGHFDGVICSDVLEHVPEDEVDLLVQRLFEYATGFVWASVCCRPAKKFFDDGTNMHVTVRPIEWWREVFARWCNGTTFYLVETP